MRNKEYQEFLANKHIRPQMLGFDVSREEVWQLATWQDKETLETRRAFLFQVDIARWALRLGKAAIFAGVGLGKTLMQLIWAYFVQKATNQPVLIIAPLAVNFQTIKEAKDKLGLVVTFAPDASAIVDNGIYIANYYRIEKFNCSVFGGVVLDESSALKGEDSKTRIYLTEAFALTRFKLCCTATPAPNDFVEFGRHSEFLNIMPETEMLSRWFRHDSAETKNWFLREWGQEHFWKWITDWAVCISKPKDLGAEYDMQGYDLPALNIHYQWVGTSEETKQRVWNEADKHGQCKLMADSVSSTSMHKVKRESLALKLEAVKAHVDSLPEDEPIVIWCEQTVESNALYQAFKHLGAVEVQGKEKPSVKEEKLIAFSEGKTRIMITKSSIAGKGLNWQHCRKPIFFSPSFSFEDEYQALGRFHRFGQLREVDALMIMSESESNIAGIVARKRADFDAMQEKMNKAMRKYGLFRNNQKEVLTVAKNDDYLSESGKFKLMMGDCIQRIHDIADETVHLTVTSIPFLSLYVYSENEADMGNCANDEEFFEHFNYLVRELYRITMTGRNVAIHIQDMPFFKGKDGFIGLKDLSGAVIRAMTEFDKPNLDDFEAVSAYKDAVAQWKLQAPKWIYHTRITIEKNPVAEMQRTKAIGLLHKQFVKDSVMTRVGNPDYVLVFRKNGINPVPVTKSLQFGDFEGIDAPYNEAVYANGDSNYSIDVWQQIANPVWRDIVQTDTLNVAVARVSQDEKHLCALQLGAIKYLIQWYSNEGEIVFDPFAGIGSVPYEAVKLKRMGLGIELKEQYFKWAVKNCLDAERIVGQRTLFDVMDEQEKQVYLPPRKALDNQEWYSIEGEKLDEYNEETKP